MSALYNDGIKPLARETSDVRSEFYFPSVLKSCRCPSPSASIRCFRAEDETLITVYREWDPQLRREHLSIGGYPRRVSDAEVETILEATSWEGKWEETRQLRNPYVRHFFSIE